MPQSKDPDEYLPDDTSDIDIAGWRAFESFSQRPSRRGFLATLGRVAFVALGVAVTEELLPVGRANAAVFQCTDWQVCGICGSQCGCADCSGQSDECPSCACVGSFWHACCCSPGPGCVNFRYKDCFKGACGSTKFNNCAGCRSCCNNQYPGTGPYRGNCGGEGPYMCTTVVSTGDC
jgi:hypothetical protein